MNVTTCVSVGHMSIKGAMCKHLAMLEWVQEISKEHQKEIVKREEETDSNSKERSGKFCHGTCNHGEEMEKWSWDSSLFWAAVYGINNMVMVS